ncbi:MAG TPA: hypothetical protein VGP38_03810 [Rubrobacter sp.]|nr:hypothetical protein [Rubrobacter sp.]
MEYVTDESGRRTRVILDIEEYERLVEAAEDADDAREHERVMAAIRSGEEERIPFNRKSDRS